MEFSDKNAGLIREWRRRDSFEETDSSDGDAVDPLEQTTDPRALGQPSPRRASTPCDKLPIRLS